MRAGESMSYQNNIQQIYKDIYRYKKSADTILVGVTKTLNIKETEEAIKAGLDHLGENRIQQASPKIEALSKIYPNVIWHFIGRIQKNKIKKIVYYFQYIHSISNWEELSIVNRYSQEYNKKTNILIQVNTSGETNKQGFNPQELSENINKIYEYDHVLFIGYMTMAPYTNNSKILHATFGDLRKLADKIAKQGISYKHLSMGMSNDYVIALQEGASMLRIGTKIFS